VTQLDGGNGFRISTPAVIGFMGYSVEHADVNGVWSGRLLVGAPFPAPGASSIGKAYVIFGSTEGFAANLSVTVSMARTAFTLTGGVNEQAGRSVSGAATSTATASRT
jgi:hypothetical protein